MKVGRLLLLAALVALAVAPGCSRQEKDAARSAEPPASRSAEEKQAEAAPAAAPVAESQGGGMAASGNAPPRVLAVPFREPRIQQGVDIEVLPEGEDADGDAVNFRCEWFVNGERLTDLEGTILPADRFRKGDRIGLRVVPSDGKADGEAYVGAEFAVPNAPPRFVSTPPQQFRAQVYTYEARAVDPDGAAVTYALETAPAGMAVDAGGRIVWTIGKDQAGSHTVRIVARDEEGMKAIQEYTLNISMPAQGEP